LVVLKLVEEEPSPSASNGESSHSVEELEADFEKDLCDLWDMSVEGDVVIVLCEFNAIQIFEGFTNEQQLAFKNIFYINRFFSMQGLYANSMPNTHVL
jgi:hypothetical protein